VDIAVEVVLAGIERVDVVGGRARTGDEVTAEERVREVLLAREDRDVVLDPRVLVLEVDRERLAGRTSALPG